MTVELVFVHGWGFEAHFWDSLAALLPQFPQQRLDCGFFGAPRDFQPGKTPRVLIGHSLGFMHGIAAHKDWSGWIAINGFARFIADDLKTGCVPVAELVAMKTRLQKNPTATLREFYRQIGAAPVVGAPDLTRLEAGLDELQSGNIDKTLPVLDVPGFALAGHNDPLVPIAASEALGCLARKGGLLWHHTGGHILPQSATAFCAAAITRFLATSFA
jgi:pimeloyl-[acyl-carrier protein] methyl ester esterase